MRHIKKLLAFSRGAAVFALTFSLFLGGCGGRRPLSRTDLFKMGDRAQIGSLTYNVIDADWKTQLGEPPNAKVPEHRFLVLHISITNGGGSDVNLPLFTIEGVNGKTYPEVNNPDGLVGWLGMIRTVKPSATEQGYVAFDVPRAAYKLQITDGGEPDKEKLARVDIPLKMEEDPALVAPDALEKK